MTRFRLTVNFKHSRFGVVSARDQVVVGPTDELSPVLLLDPPDGQGEGHVTVIRDHGLLKEFGLSALITGTPSNSVLTVITMSS